MKHDIDNGLSKAKARLEHLDDSTADEREAIERDVDHAISKLERAINDAKRDLG